MFLISTSRLCLFELYSESDKIDKARQNNHTLQKKDTSFCKKMFFHQCSAAHVSTSANTGTKNTDNDEGVANDQDPEDVSAPSRATAISSDSTPHSGSRTFSNWGCNILTHLFKEFPFLLLGRVV
jgi:hypothetical protein